MVETTVMSRAAARGSSRRWQPGMSQMYTYMIRNGPYLGQGGIHSAETCK